MKDIFHILRISNWIKNLTILLPIFFAGKLLSLTSIELFNLTLTFVVFCFSSSLIYIINDIIDIEKDKLHPKKSNRPIASGRVKNKEAYFLITILIVLLLCSIFFLPKSVIIYVLAYILLNLLYCFGLKYLSIIDVTSISLGFVFRVLAGGESTNTLVTHWIVILVFLLMFSIALAKRRDDLVLSEKRNEVFRKSQSGYTLQFIDIAKTISFTITLMAYIIYSVSTDVINRLGSEYVYVSSLPVFLGIMRYIQLTVVYKMSGSPVDILLKDKLLIVIIISWILIFIKILYV